MKRRRRRRRRKRRRTRRRRGKKKKKREKEEEEYQEGEEEEKEKISDNDNDSKESRRYSEGSVLGGRSHNEAVEGRGKGGGGGGGTGEGIRQRGVILRRGLVQKVGEGVQIIDTNQCIRWDQGSVGPRSAPAMRNKSVSYQIHQ